MGSFGLGAKRHLVALAALHLGLKGTCLHGPLVASAALDLGLKSTCFHGHHGPQLHPAPAVPKDAPGWVPASPGMMLCIRAEDSGPCSTTVALTPAVMPALEKAPLCQTAPAAAMGSGGGWGKDAVSL